MTAACLLPACGAPRPGAMPAQPDPASAVRLPSATWRDWRDPASGRTWRVFLQPPPATAAPVGGHPVLYVLDAGQSFLLAAQLAPNVMERPADVRGDAPLIVGIGHPVEGMDGAARQLDYTPPAGTPTPGEGGADALLDFMARQLQPHVAARWPVDAARQTLFGHSLAGLFTIYALLARPGLFGAYAAASPSLWWRHGHWLGRVPELLRAAPSPWQARVQLSVGALEDSEGAPSAARAQVLAVRRPVERTRVLAEMLRQQARQAPALHADFTVYPGLDHGEVMARALLDAFALARRGAA